MSTTYKILNSGNIQQLTQEVNEHLEDDWKLEGGVSAKTNSYLQAMTLTKRYNESKDTVLPDLK